MINLNITMCEPILVLLTGLQVVPSDRTTWKKLKFKDHSDVFAFYEKYASRMGFSVRTRYKKYRKRKGVIDDFPSYLTFDCHKSGQKVITKKSRSENFRARQNTRLCLSHQF